MIFVIFIGFVWFQKNTADKAQEIEEAKQEEQVTQLDSLKNDTSQAVIRVAGEEPDSNDTGAANASNVDSVAPVVEIPEVIHTMENDDLIIKTSSKGGVILSVELKNYKKYDSTALDLIDSGAFTFNYTLNTNTGIVSSSRLDFESAAATEDGISYTYTFPEGGKFVQHYKLGEGYLLDYDVEMLGMDKVIPARTREFMLDFSAKLAQQEKSLKGERDESSVYYNYVGDSDVDRLSKTSDEEDELQPNVQWISFKQKFFNSTFFFTGGNQETNNKIEVEVPEDEDESYLKLMKADMNMPYNGTAQDAFAMQMYFGPNHYQTLARLDKKLDNGINGRLEKMIPLGWGPIGWINKVVIIPVFNWLHSFISSYGLIILILTVMIKLVLIFPMYKIYISSAKMKLLKPELDELKKKHGNNMQKMQQDQMKLYKKAGVNPFGGCLPQLVQFPILIAMFRFFPASIELRQQSFLWATDLSTYDSIWNFGFDLWIYGDHVSLFTLLMAGSTFLYTLTNSNMNAGVNNQMKFIMYLMPLMLLFWFNNYASGLSYYYFLANMITFGQNYVFRKFIVDEDKLHRQMQANKKKKGSVKKSRFQKRLEEMAKKQGLDPNTMKPKGR